MSDTTIEELGSLIKEFKSTNDKILDAQKAQGVGQVGLTSGVSQLVEKQKGIESRIDILEAGLKVPFMKNMAEQNNPSFTEEEKSNLGEKYLKAMEVLSIPEYKAAYLDILIKGNNANPESHKLARAQSEKAMIVADDATGGIFAPPEFVNVLIRDIVQISEWRSLVTVRNTTKRSIWQPKRTRTTKASRVAESGTQGETQNPLFGPIEIPAYKAFARVDISDEDLEDPIFNLEAFLREDWAEQFALLEGQEITNGTGVGECTGITTDLTVPELETAASLTIAADDLIKLYATPKSGYAKNFTWVMNRTTQSVVRRLKDSSNRYLWDMGFNASPSGMAQRAPMTILGAPVVEMNDVPDVAAGKYSIILGDFKKGYTMVDRINLSILRDVYSQAGTGMVRIFARKRFGGKPVQQEAMAKLKIKA